MLPLTLFRVPSFSATAAVGLLLNLGLYGQIFVMALYFERVRGYSPLFTGLTFLPMTLTVVGANLHEVVFRSIYSARNAEFQQRAYALGGVGALTAGEAVLAAKHNLQPGPVERGWEYWVRRLEKAEAILHAAMRGKRAAPRRQTAPAKRKAARGGAKRNPRRTRR